jgi:nicotinamide-nucleotide amidase
MRKVVVLSIGDELLIGQTINTNSAWIGSELSNSGLIPSEVRVIPDKKEAILDAFTFWGGKAELVITTGGLGPTKDDITKKTIAEWLETGFVTHQPTLELLEDFFKSRNREMNDLNRLQAEVPASVEALLNTVGTAPGMKFEVKGTTFFVLPGVPYEMKELMNTYVMPWVRQNIADQFFLQKTILTVGIPESNLALLLESVENQFPEGISLAYLPSPGQVKLRLNAIGPESSKDNLAADFNESFQRIRIALQDDFTGSDNQSIEEILGEQLKTKGLTIGFAESCTGGRIGSRIVSVPGSSAYFTGSIVSYDNQVKIDVLGIDSEILQTKGAVSREVAEAMALNARRILKTDIAVSVTGIAGPTGGSPEKPVGTVWIGYADKNRFYAEKFQFEQNRERNLERTVIAALHLALKSISETFPERA